MIKGDSSEYDLLEKWSKELQLTSDFKVLTCEIGVREGLGSKIIMNSLRTITQGKCYHHIGIDPYGNLNYQHYDNGQSYTADYTNDMRDTLQKDLKDYSEFTLFNMTDIEFMKRYADYVPFYERDTQVDYILYDLVHFDGPHKTIDVLEEALFFAKRSRIGSRFIFDDFKTYNTNDILTSLKYYNFDLLEAGENKACFIRK